jgi:hypothetical protein
MLMRMEWWTEAIHKQGHTKKDMASLVMWYLGRFGRKETLAFSILYLYTSRMIVIKIKEKVAYEA